LALKEDFKTHDKAADSSCLDRDTKCIGQNRRLSLSRSGFMTHLVLSELPRPRKGLFAHLAAVQPFTGVDPFVAPKDSQLGESFIAMIAGVGSFACVRPEVQLQQIDPGEAALTDGAWMRTFTCVASGYVASQVARLHKTASAVRTLVLQQLLVAPLMGY